MKRIGTTSSAIALIFLGGWMILNKTNPALGKEVFKWWPAIFIIIGIEVLVHFSSRSEEKARFNFLIVPILILMMFVNMFQGFKWGFWNIFNGTSINWDWNWNGNYKMINTIKILPQYGTGLKFFADSARVNLKKSQDGDIKIDASVYVNNSSKQSAYEIKEIKEEGGYTFDFRDSYIRKLEVDIYIPDGYDVAVDTNSLNLTTDGFIASDFRINSNSCNVSIYGAASTIMNFDSGNIFLGDIKDVNLKFNSGNTNIKGSTEIVKIDGDSGKVDIVNNICKNVDVMMDSGIVNISTNDNNMKLDVNMDSGVCDINGDKSIGANIQRTMGSGSGVVKIQMDSGAVKFRNK